MHSAIHVIVHKPSTDTGRQELASRVAEVHADAVIARIKILDCPASQQSALLDAVIATVNTKSAEHSAHLAAAVQSSPA